MKSFQFVNQLSGYDVLTQHMLLCIVADMMSVHVMSVSSYATVDMSVANVNLYAVLARSSSYFRM